MTPCHSGEFRIKDTKHCYFNVSVKILCHHHGGARLCVWRHNNEVLKACLCRDVGPLTCRPEAANRAGLYVCCLTMSSPGDETERRGCNKAEARWGQKKAVRACACVWERALVPITD